MVRFSTSAYTLWRARALEASCLRETRDGAPNEQLLQLVWQHQRLCPEGLATTDGHPIRILHPGFWNRGRGPDFRDAVVRIDPDPPRRGDVEIDLHRADWRHHGHGGNPRYAQVMLQVVWHPPPTPGGPLPVLVLRDRLDAPLEELVAWVDLDPGLPEQVIGRCASGLRRLASEEVQALLEQAAQFRCQRKAAELAARARHVGWEQALWEGLCGALGYRHNIWPMRRLAEQRSQILEATEGGDLVRLQALLLGLSGLLTHEPGRQRSRLPDYARQLWDVWWRERDRLEPIALPAALWDLGSLRPNNHPQRRIALIAHWLMRSDLCRRLESWLERECPDGRLGQTLLAELQAGEDPFWCRHWNLTSREMPKPQPLLGADRAGDLGMNVILPWLWTRAEAGHNPTLAQEAMRRYLAWRAIQDNAVLRLARARLFAGEARCLRWTAARQQGLLQIVRDFCGHSNALCDQCVLPERLAQLAPRD